VEPVESLFRRESGRLVAALTRIFGVHNLALAEDVVQDAFCRAMEVWKFRDLRENPAAWIMAVAKNRALDVLRRERTARTFAPELTRRLESEWTLVPTLDEQFAPHAIRDDLLRMMFSCCDPRLREESQVALALHILCGFSVDEVAGAFVTTHVAMEKRLARVKKVLAQSGTTLRHRRRGGVLLAPSRGPGVSWSHPSRRSQNVGVTSHTVVNHSMALPSL
jgi:RNA polymerase sigma-70 factor (ECF subfamily)